MQKNTLLSLSLTIITLFLALVAAEMYLRFFDPVDYRQPPQQLPNNVWRELLHRSSSVPGLAYELRPNRMKYAHGAPIVTNSFGMRDEEPQPKNNTSLIRIAVLGDSFTFGFGVSGEDTYPNILERFLNRGAKGRKFEVLNFGVGGYSTRDEALVFKHKAVDWDLDLVIIGYVLNDPEIDPIQPLHSYYQETELWQYSSLLRLVAKFINSQDIRAYGEGNYTKYLHATDGKKWQSVVAALKDISSVAAEKDIPVLLTIFPIIQDRPWSDYPYQELHKQIAGTANENGIYVVDLYEKYSRYPAKKLRVSDGHPNRGGDTRLLHKRFIGG